MQPEREAMMKGLAIRDNMLCLDSFGFWALAI